METRDSLRLLLISDIHCIGTSRLAFSRLAGDVKSTADVQRDLAAALARFRGVADYVLMAGDFTENGKAHQYEAVLEVLSNYGPEWFCAIPGNHDVANFNTLESWRARTRRFKQYMAPYLPGFPGERGAKDYFPYVRPLRQGFALMGLDSTMEGTARGRLGPRQLALLDDFLSSNQFPGAHKIVFLHHETAGDAKLFKGFEIHYGNVLTDVEDFLSLIRKHAHGDAARAVTVISGHTHLKRVDTGIVPGATFLTIPSFGGRFEEDYLAVELFRDGSFRELERDTPAGKTRLLKKLGKVLFPKIHT